LFSLFIDRFALHFSALHPPVLAVMSVISPILALPAPLATGISPQLAQTLAFGVTGAYVGGLYVAQHFFGTKTAAPNEPAYPPPGHRNHPATMRLRMKAVISTTRLCMAGVFWTVKRTGNLEFKGAVSQPSVAIIDGD
jgi:prenyl protein peptidase